MKEQEKDVRRTLERGKRSSSLSHDILALLVSSLSGREGLLMSRAETFTIVTLVKACHIDALETFSANQRTE